MVEEESPSQNAVSGVGAARCAADPDVSGAVDRMMEALGASEGEMATALAAIDGARSRPPRPRTPLPGPLGVSQVVSEVEWVLRGSSVSL